MKRLIFKAINLLVKHCSSRLSQSLMISSVIGLTRKFLQETFRKNNVLEAFRKITVLGF